MTSHSSLLPAGWVLPRVPCAGITAPGQPGQELRCFPLIARQRRRLPGQRDGVRGPGPAPRTGGWCGMGGKWRGKERGGREAKGGEKRWEVPTCP